MLARFAGTCFICRMAIDIGDRIKKSGTKWVHVQCPPPRRREWSDWKNQFARAERLQEEEAYLQEMRREAALIRFQGKVPAGQELKAQEYMDSALRQGCPEAAAESMAINTANGYCPDGCCGGPNER